MLILFVSATLQHQFIFRKSPHLITSLSNPFFRTHPTFQQLYRTPARSSSHMKCSLCTRNTCPSMSIWTDSLPALGCHKEIPHPDLTEGWTVSAYPNKYTVSVRPNQDSIVIFLPRISNTLNTLEEENFQEFPCGAPQDKSCIRNRSTGFSTVRSIRKSNPGTRWAHNENSVPSRYDALPSIIIPCI